MRRGDLQRLDFIRIIFSLISYFFCSFTGFEKELEDLSPHIVIKSFRFCDYKLLNSDPYEEGSEANLIVLDSRKMKGMKLELPLPKDYI